MPERITRTLGLSMTVATLLFVAACGSSHGAPRHALDPAAVAPAAIANGQDMRGKPTPMPDLRTPMPRMRTAMPHMHGPMPGMDQAMMPAGDGRSASAAGLTLRLAQRSFAPRTAVSLRFRITDARGMAVTSFAVDQTKL